MRTTVFIVLLATLASCRAAGDYFAANRHFRQKDYPFSILRYERFLEKHRSAGRMRQNALIRLAQSYDSMHVAFDADKSYSRYLKEYPDGQFADEARESLGRLQEARAQRKEERAQELAAARKNIEDLKSQLRASPSDTDILLALGHDYWKTGQYREAGEAYLKAIELRPELRTSPILSERLLFDVQGRLVVLSPQDRVTLDIEQEPLVIEGLHERRSRGIQDFFTPRRTFYEISGTVRNRSTWPVMGVEVQVTLLDPLEQILEVGTAPIGTLYPQQSRPFLVRSGLDAEAMGNITRYRVQPIFQE